MPPPRPFADVEYDGQPRQTRRERFLQRMDALMPWARLELLAERDFDGPLSVHTEYTTRQDVIATVGGKDRSADADAVRARGATQDLQFLRSRWAAIQQAGEGAA